MNLGPQGGQGPPGQANSQPAGGQPRPNQQPMYRPEMMRNINFLTDEEKMKYEKGLSALWKTYDTFAQGTLEKAEAQKKIVQFGAMLASKVTQRKQALQAQQAQRAQQQAQQQGQQSLPAARVGPQGQQIPGPGQGPGQGPGPGPGQQQPVQRPMPQQQPPQHPQAVQNIQQQQTTPLLAAQAAISGPGNPGNLTPSTPTIGNLPATNNPLPPGAAPPATKLPPQYVELVQNLNVPAPANVPDKAKWLNELKQRYARALMQMDASRGNINKVDQHLKEREEKGIPLSEEEKKSVKDRKDTLIKQFQDARTFVEGVRSQQKAPQAQTQTAPSPANGPGPGAAGTQQRPQPPPNQTATAAGAAQQAKPQVQVPTSNAPPNNSMNNPMMNNPIQNNGMQNSTAAVNAAFEAAKNQQIAAGRPPHVMNGGMAGPQGSQSHQAQVPTAPTQTQQNQNQNQNQNQMSQMNPISQAPLSQQTPSQPQPHQPPIKIEPGTQPHPIPTPINTAIVSNMGGMPSAGTPTQNNLRVQTPQSATPTGASARPLTHAGAVNLANRSGSNAGPMNTGQGGTPASAQGVMGAAVQQGHPHAHPPQQGTPGSNVTSKLPIPKNLPERAMQAPIPVAATTQSRPTYSQGTGIGGGVMNQPALPKTPGYSLEGEGERVLNKKKLDELVRQVCGGTEEGQEGNLLAPEVEESVLNLADAFMDNVIHQACRNAKERGSKVLEIRDLQLVLERTYNIRIPGYSSEELRTVRKVQPNAQWITKMSAVQAAKVMPGKGDL